MNTEWLRINLIGGLLLLLAIVGIGCAMDADEEQVFSTIASDAQSTDWDLLGNSPDMQHHSSLSQINTETVSDLGLAWATDLPTGWARWQSSHQEWTNLPGRIAEPGLCE